MATIATPMSSSISVKPMILRARPVEQLVLAWTRLTWCARAHGDAAAASSGNPEFRGCGDLSQRNGTLPPMMPLLDASRGSDWRKDGAGHRFPFLLYGGGSRRQPRYPLLSSWAGSFASLPCDSFAVCCFSSQCAATRHDRYLQSRSRSIERRRAAVTDRRAG